jgi:putative tryptophan/tyrosine transport system substrate-binding protein
VLMQRRDFITLLGGAAATWPLAARAQQAGKLSTIGFLVAGTPESHGKWVAAFAQRMPELGWIEGRNAHWRAEFALQPCAESRP